MPLAFSSADAAKPRAAAIFWTPAASEGAPSACETCARPQALALHGRRLSPLSATGLSHGTRSDAYMECARPFRKGEVVENWHAVCNLDQIAASMAGTLSQEGQAKWKHCSNKSKQLLSMPQRARHWLAFVQTDLL